LRRWQLWLGLLVSAVFLVWALRGLRLDEVWAVARTARLGWILPGVAAYFVGVWVRTWRWQYLLRPLQRLGTGQLLSVVAIGYMGNNVYPARAGEVLRAYLVRRRWGVPISATLATILVERAFDGVVMLGFVFLTLPDLARASGAGELGNRIYSLALGGAALFLAASAGLVAMAIWPAAAGRLFRGLAARVLPRPWRGPGQALVDRFLTGLASLRSPADGLMLLLTSVVIWLLETGKYWFVMLAFPFRVSFFVLMLMNGMVNLATTIPSAPGYLGTFDAPGIAVLSAAGVPPDVAAAYTLVLHAALWLPITALGAVLLGRESLSWRQVRQELAGQAPP
jgi:hypothetical protein